MEHSKEDRQVFVLVRDTVGKVVSRKSKCGYQALKGMMFREIDSDGKSISLQSIHDQKQTLHSTLDHVIPICQDIADILQSVPSHNDRYEIFDKKKDLLEKAIKARNYTEVQVETPKGIRAGKLSYKGVMRKKVGTYFGVEFDKPVGDSNGFHNGFSYFSCKKDHGIFIAIDKIKDFPNVQLPQTEMKSVLNPTPALDFQEQFPHLPIGTRVIAFIDRRGKSFSRHIRGKLQYLGQPAAGGEIIAGIVLDEDLKNPVERNQIQYHGKKLFKCHNDRYFLAKPETLLPEDQFKPEEGDISEQYEILSNSEVDEPKPQQMNRKKNISESKHAEHYNSIPGNHSNQHCATEHEDEESSKLRSAKIEGCNRSIESLKKDMGIDNRSFRFTHENQSDTDYLSEKKEQLGREKNKKIDELCDRRSNGQTSSLPSGLRLLNGNDPSIYLNVDHSDGKININHFQHDQLDNTTGLETPADSNNKNEFQGTSSFNQQQSFMSDVSDSPDAGMYTGTPDAGMYTGTPDAGMYTASQRKNENPKFDGTDEHSNAQKFQLEQFDESSLQIGSMVELNIRGEAYYGVIKWKGYSDNYPETYMAGLEMEDFIQGGTDGTFMGRRYFVCSTGRGFFCKMSQLKADQRFRQSYSLKQGHSLKDVEVIKGCIVPPENLDGRYMGRNKGIQGHHNSCYMDTTLFAMFAFTHIFDIALNRKQRKNDIKEYEIVQSILKEQIVNPLRQNGFVNHQSVMDLRKYLNDLGDIGGFLDEEKDPEEFVNLLFDKVLQVDHFVRLRQNGSREEASHLYQIFAEKDVKNPLPSVQYLFDLSFLTANLQLLEEPSVMILQMPRFGLQKLYKRILIEPTLDITSVLSTVVHPCIICSNEATVYCRDCACTFGWSNVFVYLCQSCCRSVHSHYKRRHHKAIKALHSSSSQNYPMPSIYTQHVSSDHPDELISKPAAAQPRVLMELFAVVCIKTSHYVSFAKCGSGEDEGWVFFDSMADRHGGQNGYNIPEVSQMNDLKYYLNAPASEIANLDTKNDERILRLYEDASLCFYRNKNVAMYK